MRSMTSRCILGLLGAAVVSGGRPGFGQSVAWFALDPRVMHVDTSDPVTLTVKIQGTASSVFVRLAGGAIVPLAPVGGNLYTGALTPAQVLDGYSAGDQHNFVGFIEFPPSTTRINLFANVRTALMPNVPVHHVAADVQTTSRVVNIRSDVFFGGNHVPPSITTRFYDFFGDDYDFIATILQVRAVANRSFRHLRNDTQGIGLELFDSADAFGSPARLQGTINYPTDSFFDLAETGSLHEIGHRWINFLDYPLLGQSSAHWPISDLAPGVMGYSVPNGQGLQFPFELVELPGGDYLLVSVPLPREFTDLDLYLMGLVPPDEVEPHFVFDNQNQPLVAGGILHGPVTEFTVDDVIAIDGPRIPAAGSAQTTFSVATVVLSRNGLLGVDEMAFFDHMAARGESLVELPFSLGFVSGLTKPFHLATFGLGSLTTTLPAACPGDVAPSDEDGFFGNGVTGFADLIAVLTAWGPCSECPEDADASGAVGLSDLNLVLAGWGVCK